MADTHKDLDALRYYFASESSLKDKDRLKNAAYESYRNKVVALAAVPAFSSLAQIYYMNRVGFGAHHKFWLHIKVMSAFGGLLFIYHERGNLQKKWQYYDRLYPEPTQLQKSLVTEAEMYAKREQLGIKEQTLEEKSVLDPVTRREYTQMYSLPPAPTVMAEADPNASGIKPHYGKS